MKMAAEAAHMRRIVLLTQSDIGMDKLPRKMTPGETNTSF